MINKVGKASKNVLKLIFALLIILGLLLIIVLIINNNPVNKKLKFIYNDEKDANISIMPTNVDKLFVNYKGNINQKAIYKTMNLFTTELVEEYFLATNSLSNEELESYYNNNSVEIEKLLGITEKSKFIKFCNYLKENLKTNNLELLSYTINPKSVKRFNNQTNAVIIVNYESNNPIAFTIKIQNKEDKSKTPIYFEECVDENMKSYEYIPNDYETPDTIEPTGKVIE